MAGKPTTLGDFPGGWFLALFPSGNDYDMSIWKITIYSGLSIETSAFFHSYVTNYQRVYPRDYL